MIIRERVHEARLAAMIAKDPVLAKGIGIELGRKREGPIPGKPENRIQDKKERTSSDAQ